MISLKTFSGSALVIILMICLILGLLAGAVLNFQTGQMHLLSKSATDYLALCVAEAGLHAVLSEMKADYQFVTHGNPYIPAEGWPSPAQRRYNYLSDTSTLKLDSNERGTYSGTIHFPKMKMEGKFKVRMKLQNAKNSTLTTTIDESHRYFLIEAAGRVNNSHRLITVVVEKSVPGNFLLYDGQILDIGAFGPYRHSQGIIQNARLYGHEMITFTRRGNNDRSFELKNIEKIYSPGHIIANHAFNINFSTGKQGSISSSNDSNNFGKFETFSNKKNGKVVDYFLQDGITGGKSHKFPQLNPNYWKSAAKPSPKVLKAGSSYKNFSESKWRNPAKPNEKVYDLFFGWNYKNNDEKVLLYSEVPLRVWGCPPHKALTIFCEKDVYIAGDFNANPDNPQNYNARHREYLNHPRNGTDKNGVAILSMGRIWFDYSNPMLFLHNELKTLIDYEVGMTLADEELDENIQKSTFFPFKASTGSIDSRTPITGANFSVVASLAGLPKEPPEVIPATLIGIAMHPALSRLREYLKPSDNSEEYKNRFAIGSSITRTEICSMIGNSAYMTGTISKTLRNKIVDMILKQAQEDIEKGASNKTFGPWNVAERLFRQARKYPSSGFKMPEMTVNALLIDSSQINADWSLGNSAEKPRNELGNIESKEMQSFPFAERGFILRHLGSMIHLRNREEKVKITPSLRDDSPVIRHNVFDRTYAQSGGDYFPPYPLAGFSILTWSDKILQAEDFDKL